MNFMQKMMFNVYQSELPFEETVNVLTKSAKENGWEIPMTHDLQKGYQESGYEDMTKMEIIYFCNPSGGYKILQNDEYKPMSVMMPMGVSVYETKSGQVFVSGMNLERMSMMFGDTVVKDVLREGAANYAKSLENFAKPEESSNDIKVDGGRCLLGCVSGIATVVALFGLLGLIAKKVLPIIMPKMMTTMMPHMMTAMEDAGVPCAEIMQEHLSAQNND